MGRKSSVTLPSEQASRYDATDPVCCNTQMNESARQTSKALELLCEREGGIDLVAGAIGSSKATLDQIIKARPLPSGRARSLGRDLRERLDRKFPGWSSLGPTLSQVAPNALVAQEVSQHYAILLPPLVSEEQVLSGTDKVFLLEVTDTSGGDNYPKGSFIMWSRDRPTSPGEVVLVQDRFRQLHIRRIRQAKQPGVWMAEPLAAGYTVLHSTDDALTVVAVFEGYRRPA